MPRGELAPQENPDQSPQLPDSTTKEEQLEAIDLAVEKTTDAFLETQTDMEGPPPLPEEFLAAYDANEKLKKEKADEEDFLNRDPNVIRARANYNRVDADMLALGILMTESPDANKRAQAKRKYEKMCGVGLNNPKNGEFNVAINALHRAEDRSREKRIAMKKMHEARVAQTALDKKMNDVGAIEKQLGIAAVPPTELAEVSHLMRDAVAANTDAEIAEEKVSEPDVALESQITLAQQEARAAGDRNLTSEAIQKKVGELQRAATMNFMVPQDRMTDVKFLRSTYNEALAFVTKLSEFKNGIEAQNLTDTQKINIYQSIDAAHDALDLQLGRIGDVLKTAEKNDFHEQSLSYTPSRKQLVRTAVGLNRGLSEEQDRYAASDWMQTEENYAPPVVQKPKKGFFGSFGAKVAGGLAGLAAAFTFGSSRAPERTVAPNFTQPENVHMGDSEHHNPLHFVDTLRNAAPQTVTELPDIRIKAGGRSVASPDVRRVHPDHPIVQRTMEKIDNEIAPTVVFAPGSETERRVDEEVKKAMVPIDAAINSATPDVPKIFPAEGEENLAPQEKKEDPLSIVPTIETGTTELAGKDADEAPVTVENMVEPVGEAPKPVEEIAEGDSGIDTDETEGGTAEMDSNTKNKKGRLPGYLEKPLQEIGEDVRRSMEQIDRDNDRFAAQTQEYLNKKAEVPKNKKKTVSFKSSAKAKSKGKSGKVSKPLTSEQKAEVQVAANEALKSVDKILNEESKPGLNLFGGEAGPSKITDLSTAKREWQMAFENVQLAKDTGQPLEIVAELQKDLDAAHDTYERLANPGAYTSKERRSALSLGELALSGDLSRVDNKMLDARMAALIKQESAFNDKFAQATFDAQQKGGALAAAEISEKDRKALTGVVGERARIQAEMVRRAGGTKSSSDTSRGTVMSGGVDLAPGTTENGGYTSTERGSDTEMSGGVILAPGTTEIKKPNLDRENERYNELLKDLNSIEKSDGKNTLEYKRAQKALDDFLGDLKD